ncbi:MAG TPA: DUF2235 domain-containing protein, partial [Chthoniobacterales bacterium]
MPTEDTTSEPVKRRERPERSDAAAEDYKRRRRLVLCLDGTWNKRDSGTNVYHLANMVADGVVDDGTKQFIYYDEGVGTGVLDNVTGGAFGIGLSENVREAYDWLIEHYRDSESGDALEADEIYIFGFSRGAFTARSLVGLIANCGLLHRGAPLPPEQLWNRYRELGNRVAQSQSGSGGSGSRKHAKKPNLNRIKHLQPDGWSNAVDERIAPEADWTETDHLLVKWSRRVPIKCVGVFDTVGALGIEALAVPWIRERTAQFHNTQLSSMVINAFHALAIDEQRASFSHIPWTRSVAQAPIMQVLAPDAHVEQRWFIGAHSNVGGGYYDDTLAQLPLAWMVRHCQGLGLKFRPLRGQEPDVLTSTHLDDCVPLVDDVSAQQPAHVCDSYTQFMGGAWRYLVRGKREYRRIKPPPDFENGEEVESIDEQLDPSVLQLAARDERYNPPNLWAFLHPDGTSTDRKPKNPDWRAASLISLAVWLGFLAAGAQLVARLTLTNAIAIGAVVVLASVIAAAADLTESAINFSAALAPAGTADAQRRKSILNALIFTRVLGLLLVLLGLVNLVIFLVHLLGYPAPFVELVWALALLGLVLQQSMAGRWAAKAMTDAGLGSVTALQFVTQPAQIAAELRTWLRKAPSAFVAVRRSLWRDMMGYIPSLTATFAAGLWLLLDECSVLLKDIP